MMYYRAKKTILFFLLATFYLLAPRRLGEVGLAASQTLADEFSLGISPSVVRITAVQKQIINTSLELENFSEDDVNLSISYREFEASDSLDGQVRFIPNSQSFARLISGIKILKDSKAVERIILGPKQKQKLGLQITIPDDSSRDYTFSIIFINTKSVNTTSETSFSNINAGIGANVLLSVGESKPVAVIHEFATPNLTQHGPVLFVVRVQNRGRHLVRATGVILIHNMFGQTVGKIDLEPIDILAGKSRSFYQNTDLIDSTNESSLSGSEENSLLKTISWDESFLLGSYQATLNLKLSDSGTVYSRKIRFFALPYQTVLLFVLVVTVIIFIKKRVDAYLSA